MLLQISMLCSPLSRGLLFSVLSKLFCSVYTKRVYQDIFGASEQVPEFPRPRRVSIQKEKASTQFGRVLEQRSHTAWQACTCLHDCVVGRHARDMHPWARDRTRISTGSVAVILLAVIFSVGVSMHTWAQALRSSSSVIFVAF